MKFAIVAASLLPLLKLSAALYIPADAETLAKFAESSLTKESAPASDYLAPFATSGNAKANLIEDSYIVVFNDDVDDTIIGQHFFWLNDHHIDAVNSLKKRDGQHPFLSTNEESTSHGLNHVFNVANGLKGYAGKFLPETIEAIRKDKNVKFIEHDSRVFATEFETQKDSPWGLARISHRESLSLGTFNKYLYDDQGGEGVTAYVIDTGTNIDHVDFEGRAAWGKTIPDNDQDVDGNGHGTHCSGTIAGKRYGVAKKANVVAVKVLRSNGSGTMSDVLKGVEWAAAAHIDATKKNKKGFKGSTANMSLGGGKSPSLDLAVNAAVKAGIHFAVAAGNDNADACNYSPAAAKDAVTVGASALSDDRAYFSNYGKCVDLFGPGVNIQSTYIGSKYAVATLSGTSMASPHVAGILSYFLSLQPSTDSEFAVSGAVSPLQLKKNLINYSSKGLLKDIPEDTPNLLIFNGAGKNITEFWHPESVKAEGEIEEQEFKILPAAEERIANDIKSVKTEVYHLLEALKGRIEKLEY
ncbi:hypothetical protein DV454_000948 [Geotrichum candidum]|nr:hypothetical protein DV454_000948 [Geotrichum candidum]